MNLVLTIVIFLTLVIAVHAEDKISCEQLESVAGSTMSARQRGVAMIEMIKIVNENFKTPAVNTLVTEVVKDAYNKPRFSTKKYQQNAIVDFRNKWYLRCIEVRDKQE